MYGESGNSLQCANFQFIPNAALLAVHGTKSALALRSRNRICADSADQRRYGFIHLTIVLVQSELLNSL